jgi:hypothetical protein
LPALSGIQGTHREHRRTVGDRQRTAGEVVSIDIFDTLEQGSDQWLAARCGIITASQMGKLITPTLKTADNETSRGLTLTLAAERITGEVEFVYPTHDMQRGTEDEPVARQVYADNYAPVDEVGFILRTEDTYRIGYSPDGLVGTDGLIEIKSRKPHVHIKTILSGKPPAENMAQLMVGLFVTGRRWIDYCSFSAGLPFWVTRVYPDPAWFTAITSAAEAFETNVADVISRYNNETAGLPMTEKRLEIEDLTF